MCALVSYWISWERLKENDDQNYKRHCIEMVYNYFVAQFWQSEDGNTQQIESESL
ncbi:hypothetical protein MTR_6g038680 [Medicago truncatula]|uniref:Uncharacterized protein n=1 Tax=Medicago truncatula TaxID=3880 RepID=A0A072UA75_MEDTR|nr:hypothetical protein MTR_6g038680 [Medicago truncatula]